MTLSKKSTGLGNQPSQFAQGWGYSQDTRLPVSGKAWENQDRSVTNPRLHLMILRNQLLYSWHLQNLCIRWVWTGQRTVDLKTWVSQPHSEQGRSFVNPCSSSAKWRRKLLPPTPHKQIVKAERADVMKTPNALQNSPEIKGTAARHLGKGAGFGTGRS